MRRQTALHAQLQNRLGIFRHSGNDNSRLRFVEETLIEPLRAGLSQIDRRAQETVRLETRFRDSDSESALAAVMRAAYIAGPDQLAKGILQCQLAFEIDPRRKARFQTVHDLE